MRLHEERETMTLKTNTSHKMHWISQERYETKENMASNLR
jgi:hypothetical protein